MQNRRTPRQGDDAAPTDLVQDHRKEPRTDPEPDAQGAVVRSPASGVFHGAIVDVSFSGLALAIDDASGLSVGEPVEVLYRCERIPAVVKYIVPGEGHDRVGFELEPDRWGGFE